MSTSAETIIIAHRGYSSAYPENTLAAVRGAAELNPAPVFIEIDLHRSSDGVLVVSHDDNTKRATGVDAMIRNTPYSMLKTFSAGYKEKFGDRFHDEKLPTLEEVLDIVKDKPIGIMIECKQLLLEDQVIELLRKRGELEKHVLASFDEMTVYRAKQIEPKLKTLYLAGKVSDTVIGRLQDVGADIIGFNHGDNAPGAVKRAHDEGYIVWVWTVDDGKDIQDWIIAGADGIITNRPEDALKIKGTLEK